MLALPPQMHCPARSAVLPRPLRLAALALLLCSAASALPAAQPPVSGALIPDGDFSTPNAAGDFPEGWGTRNPDNGLTWETENGHRFMRLVARRPGQLQTLYRSFGLKNAALRAMELTVRYRASSVRPGPGPGQDARVLIAFEDATGRTLDDPPAPLLLPPSMDWKEARARVLVPADAARWILVAGLVHAAAGQVDVAQITAAPLPAAEADSLAAAAPRPAAPFASLIPNDTFATPDAGGKWPAGWGQPVDGMTWEKEGDARFIRATVQQPGDAVMLNKTVPLPPGYQGIELLIRWRADGIEHGEHEWFDARTIVHFVGADGQSIPAAGGDYIFTHKPAPTGWKEGTRTYLVPEGATGFHLMAGLFKTRAGTLDLAKIRISPMSDATANLEGITRAAYGSWKHDEDAAHDRRTVREIEAQLAATGNFVPNGGFEKVNGDGNPEAWGKQQGGDGITWTEEKGDHFMHLISQDPHKTRMLYRMVPLTPDLKGIEIKVRYRTVGITPGDLPPGDARAAMHFLDGSRWGHMEAGKEMLPEPAPIVFSSAAKDWTEATVRCRVPAGATKIQFMPGLWNVAAGALDLSDIRITPLSDADAQAIPVPAPTPVPMAPAGPAPANPAPDAATPPESP